MKPLASPLNPPPIARPSMPTNVLAWDTLRREVEAKWGDTNITLAFQATNISSAEVVIDAVRSSCGCTLVKLPAEPWILAPGAGGPLEVNVDLRGKHGQLNKFIYVQTSAGFCLLRLQVKIPEIPPGDNAARRLLNLSAAQADRQAVFKNDCARCHVTPTLGKMGRPLYLTACGICHEVPERASMVPDLHVIRRVPTAGYWRQWISAGRSGTLMPGFAQSEGGPLTVEQINSLVDYLLREYPQEKPGMISEAEIARNPMIETNSPPAK